jgi:Uma2 family endonuclease
LRILQPLNKFAPICPELAFEVMSPSDRLTIVRSKIETYMRNGASCAILIDPEEHTVEVRAQNDDWTLSDQLLSIGVSVLTGAMEPFELALNELFAV